MASVKFEKTPKRVITPLLAAAGGVAIGAFLRGQKARHIEQQAIRFVKNANARAESAEKKSRHDHLTGLYTRRVLDEKLSEVIGRSDQANRNSLLLVDVDDFKNLNDSNGHNAGDRVLRNVASTLKDNSRLGDTPARFGGDEMALLLLRASESEAAIVAERIRASVESDGQAKVSIGVASIDSALDLEANLQNADQALYAAKNNGRNEVAVYSSLGR